MAIVSMSKFNLFSFGYDRKALLKNLQKFEYVHINDLKLKEDEQLKELDHVRVPEELVAINEDLVKTKWVINLLNQYYEKPGALAALKKGDRELSLSQVQEIAKNFNFGQSYSAIKNIHDEITLHQQEQQNIESSIQEFVPWKDLNISGRDIKNIKQADVFLGTIPKRSYPDLEESVKDHKETVLESISEVNGLIYILGISSKDESSVFIENLRKHGFSQIVLKTDNLAKDEIAHLEEKLSQTKEEIDKSELKLKEKVNELEDFKIYHDYLVNEHLKDSSSEKFLKTENVDIIEGFVPTDKVSKFEKVLDDILPNRYYLEIEEVPKTQEDVPVMLKNNKFVTPFEALTEMYSLPRYNEIDPTPLFAPFYAVFAGMMVGDLGYGLILFITTLGALVGFNLKPKMRTFVQFFFILSITTMFWGFIYGSIFGGIIPMKAIIDPSKDYTTLIILSLIFGGIHLYFGLAIKAYMAIRDGHPLDAIYDVLFWYMALSGAIVLILTGPLSLAPIVGTIAKVVMIAGMVGILLTGGRDAESIGGKIGNGVYSLYGITSYIGDFVSYLRLMALGLAGAFIAVAINIIVQMMVGKGILATIAGVLIFVVFQLFNMFLSYLSAYVHSARLTYVEMFNKFYEGGGKPFKRMIEESKYFNIKNQND